MVLALASVAANAHGSSTPPAHESASRETPLTRAASHRHDAGRCRLKCSEKTVCDDCYHSGSGVALLADDDQSAPFRRASLAAKPAVLISSRNLAVDPPPPRRRAA